MPKEAPNSCGRFQSAVDENLVRHRSILDILSKFQETSSRVNRAVVKSVTNCGCMSIAASKQKIPKDCSYSELKEHLQSHISGELCESCQDVLELELGHHLFYIAAICNSLGLELDEVLTKELHRVGALGTFQLR